MPVPNPASDGPRTEDQFHDELIRLVRTAHDNGVDVEGGWMDRGPDPERPDWGIEIHRVVERRSSLDVG